MVSLVLSRRGEEETEGVVFARVVKVDTGQVLVLKGKPEVKLELGEMDRLGLEVFSTLDVLGAGEEEMLDDGLETLLDLEEVELEEVELEEVELGKYELEEIELENDLENLVLKELGLLILKSV